MARLFITPREIDLISDITKEVMKDVIGQKIYYYSISMTKTKIHEVYDEAPEKIFEAPLEIDAMVNSKGSISVKCEYCASLYMFKKQEL